MSGQTQNAKTTDVAVETSLLEKLESVVKEACLNRQDTILNAVRVLPPWQNQTWEGVEFYDAGNTTEALVEKFMRGDNVPPHVTLSIVDKRYQAELREFQKEISGQLLQRAVWLQCDEPFVFPQNSASKELGAEGVAVVMLLKVPRALRWVRDAALHVVPAHRNLFQGVAKGETKWEPHITVGYIRVDDESSRDKFLAHLAAYRGCHIEVEGWADL